jgi:hypothetical protein
MNTKKPAALLSAALISAGAEPTAVGTDTCVGPGENLCTITSPTLKHIPEPDLCAPQMPRVRAEQAPGPHAYFLNAETGRFTMTGFDAELIALSSP